MTIEGLIKEAYFKEQAPVVAPADEMQKIATALNRVASLPYNEAAHDAVCGVLKIAAAAFDKLVVKTSEMEKVSEVRGIIDEMLDRGMISKEDINVKTSALLKKNNHELEIVKEAMELAGSNLSAGVFDSGPVSMSNEKREIFQEVF